MKFDYVVVGGGTAGCVLAARLAAREDCSVALLEAGPEDNLPEIAMPAALGLLFKTHVDWDFDTDPEPQLEGRCSYLPRGRCSVARARSTGWSISGVTAPTSMDGSRSGARDGATRTCAVLPAL